MGKCSASPNPSSELTDKVSAASHHGDSEGHRAVWVHSPTTHPALTPDHVHWRAGGLYGVLCGSQVAFTTLSTQMAAGSSPVSCRHFSWCEDSPG